MDGVSLTNIEDVGVDLKGGGPVTVINTTMTEAVGFTAKGDRRRAGLRRL